MNDGKHLHDIRTTPVDDPVAAFQHLTDIRSSEFWYDAAGVGEGCELGRAAKHTLDLALRVNGGILCDVLPDGGEVAECRLGPDNVYGWDRSRATASSCGTIRPAFASARPASVAWRT